MYSWQRMVGYQAVIRPAPKKDDMYELKKTLTIWLPLCLFVCGSATYLSNDLPALSNDGAFQSSYSAIPAQSYQYANGLGTGP